MADRRRRKTDVEKKENPNVKVTLTFDERLLQKIDDYADSHYMSRSGMVAYACNQIFLAEETKELMKDMNVTLQMLLQKVNSTPDYVVSDEERQELEHIQFATKMLAGDYMKNIPDLK